jgi:hypothetical protein
LARTRLLHDITLHIYLFLTMSRYACPNAQCGMRFALEEHMRAHWNKSSCSRVYNAASAQAVGAAAAAHYHGAAGGSPPPPSPDGVEEESIQCMPVSTTTAGNSKASSIVTKPMISKGRSPPILAESKLRANKKPMLDHGIESPFTNFFPLGGIDRANTTDPLLDDGFPAEDGDEFYQDNNNETPDGDDDSSSVDEDSNQHQKIADNTYVERTAGLRVQFTKEEMASIDLLKILQDSGIPLRAYDLIVKWAGKWAEKKTDFVIVSKRTKKTKMKRLSSRLGFDSLKPTIVPCLLPNAKETYDLPVFSFVAAFASMIANPKLMKEEFLQFNQPGDIMAPPTFGRRSDQFWHCDTNDGDLYRKAYKEVVQKPNQFLVTLMFFSDRTHTDRHGRLTLEPLMVTFSSLFNLKARNNPLFWSILGYLPYGSNYDYRSATHKLDDYHYVLGCILKELGELQHSEKPFLTLDLNYTKTDQEGKEVMVHHPNVDFHFRALTVNGDSEGQDKQCGKIAVTGQYPSNYHCRICNCFRDDLDNPHVHVNYIKAPTIEKLVETSFDPDISQMRRVKAREKLKLATYKPVQLGWSQVVFCDKEHGINGAVPPDILHMIRHGLIQYQLESIFGLKRILQKARKPKSRVTPILNDDPSNSASELEDNPDEYMNDGDDAEAGLLFEEYTPLDESILSRNFIFNKGVKEKLDVFAKGIGRALQRQSTKDFSRAYFSSGISSNSKKDGFEEVMVVLLLVIIMCSDGFGTELCNMMNKNQPDDSISRSDATIQLLVAMLLLDDCLHWNWILHPELKQLREYIPLFLDRYKAVVNRTEGAQLKILKFHLLTHIGWVYKRFGLFKAVDTETTEAAHKGHKLAGLQTSRNPKYFEADTAKKYFAIELIKQATLQQSKGSTALSTNDADVPIPTYRPWLEGNLHFVNAQGVFFTKQYTQQSKWDNVELTTAISRFLRHEVLEQHHMTHLDLFTLAIVYIYQEDKYTGDFQQKPVRVRAHPRFVSSADKFGYPNYHWVIVRGATEEDTVLCRCLAFCKIQEINYIVGQCNNEEPYLLGNHVQEIVLGFSIHNDMIRLIPLTDVIDTACVIPNNFDQPPPITKWLYVKGKDHWSDSFRREMQQTIDNNNLKMQPDKE